MTKGVGDALEDGNQVEEKESRGEERATRKTLAQAPDPEKPCAETEGLKDEPQHCPQRQIGQQIQPSERQPVAQKEHRQPQIERKGRESCPHADRQPDRQPPNPSLL